MLDPPLFVATCLELFPGNASGKPYTHWNNEPSAKPQREDISTRWWQDKGHCTCDLVCSHMLPLMIWGAQWDSANCPLSYVKVTDVFWYVKVTDVFWGQRLTTRTSWAHLTAQSPERMLHIACSDRMIYIGGWAKLWHSIDSMKGVIWRRLSPTLGLCRLRILRTNSIKVA